MTAAGMPGVFGDVDPTDHAAEAEARLGRQRQGRDGLARFMADAIAARYPG